MIGRTLTNEQMQRAAELARENVERLKTQTIKPLRPYKPANRRSKRGGRRNLTPTSQATLVHTLAGKVAFVKAPPAEPLLPD